MSEQHSQFHQQFSAMDQIGVTWEWSVDWLARQHANVPGNMLIQGIIELGFTPRRVVDGIAYFDGEQYARLQTWLLQKADELQAKYQRVNDDE